MLKFRVEKMIKIFITFFMNLKLIMQHYNILMDEFVSKDLSIE